jgi:hypothetical protein
MRTVACSILCALALLAGGPDPAAAADPVGPFCLTLDAFVDRIELFLLPNGTAQFVLTGRDVSFPDSYGGSAIVNGNDFIFSLFGGNGGGAGTITFSGRVNIPTRKGEGRCSILPAARIISPATRRRGSRSA